MPIVKITYQRSYVIGPFLQERIGVEIDLTEGQDAMQALHEAKKLTDQFNIEANPHLQSGPQPQEPEVLPVQQVEKPFEPISLLEQIESCTSPTVLKVFLKMLKTNEERSAYENKMDELLSKPTIKNAS